MNAMDELRQYISKNAIRGACTCGKCLDAPQNPKEKQPQGHTVDLEFFKVAAKESAKADELRKLVQEALPQCFDGEEHNYINLGASIGDQGYALMLIGLGHILKLWIALSPATVLGDSVPEALRKQMAGMGMIALKADKEPVAQEDISGT